MTSVGTLLNQLPCRSKALKIAVVGSGQSAAECLLDVHRRLESMPAPDGAHDVHMIIRKGSLKPSDDSPFVNEIFDPESKHQSHCDTHAVSELSHLLSRDKRLV